MTPEQKLQRWIELRELLYLRVQAFEKKWERARNQEKRDYWRGKYGLYRAILYKSTRHNMRKPTQRFTGKFGETDGYVFGFVRRVEAETWWKQREINRKQEGQTKFLTTHYYARWFMSDSLGADYGAFICDSCGATFFHSPSTITKAAKEIFHCCCGNCTNQIIYRDHKSTPYT